MLISSDSVVRLRYRISDPLDEILDEGSEPLEYLQGHGEFFESIEAALHGRGVGYENIFHLEPEDAFGDYDADLLRVVERASLPDGIEPGMQFEGVPGDDDASDDDEIAIFTVTDVTDDVVVLDGNHPLAGRALRVWVRVEAVRAATDDELADGHAGGVPGVTIVDGSAKPSLH